MSTISNNYLPIAFKLDHNLKQDIFDHDPNPKFSYDIDYPKFSLGFQHFIHQSKDKMSIVESFKGQKRVYYVLNEFERNVDDYKSDINNASKTYFEIDKKPDILSRAFFKLWELLFMFDLIDLNSKDFVSAHLAEGPGSFIQATMFYRDKFAKSGLSKNDKYYAVTLHGEGIQQHVPKLEDNFVKYYEKEKPVRFIMQKTYSKAQGGGSGANSSPDKCNGDLTDKKTRILFGGNFKQKKADFITADGGFDWKNENIQEQEAFKLILAQIIMALEIQAVKGHFVCKFYETFTNVSSKFMSILLSFYNKVYIVKPLMSRASNSEKYAVCMDFKPIKDTDRAKKIEKLNDIIESMNKTNSNLVDLFPEYHIDDSLKTILIKLNTDIANKQFQVINKMISFIEKQNYRGDEYSESRELQIKASDYWTQTFLPEQKEFESKRNKIIKSSKDLLETNQELVTKMQKKLDLN